MGCSLLHTGANLSYQTKPYTRQREGKRLWCLLSVLGWLFGSVCFANLKPSRPVVWPPLPPNTHRDVCIIAHMRKLCKLFSPIWSQGNLTAQKIHFIKPFKRGVPCRLQNRLRPWKVACIKAHTQTAPNPCFFRGRHRHSRHTIGL